MQSSQQKSNDINLNNHADKLQLICIMGFGDTLIVSAFKEAIEKYHNVKTHFVIKPEHEIVMKLYGITDYSIHNFNQHELEEISKNQELKNGSKYVCNYSLVKNSEELIQTWRNIEISFIDLYKKTLLLPKEAEFKKPTNVPCITPELNEKIKDIAPLDKLVLFSPECFSTERISKGALEYEVKELNKKGYTVISSVKDKSEALKGTKYIPLSLYEALALGINCAEVYAVRSGFVDLIMQYREDLTVYYPSIKIFKKFNLKSFGNSKANEIFIDTNASFIEKHGSCFHTEHKYSEKLFRFYITLFRIKRNYSHKERIFGLYRRLNSIDYRFLFIPVWKIKYFENFKKHYLFGIICVHKENY